MSAAESIAEALAAIVGPAHVQALDGLGGELGVRADADADAEVGTDAEVGAEVEVARGDETQAASAAGDAWLVVPGSAVEVAELLALANRERVSVVPVGRGTRAPRPPQRAGEAPRPCMFVRSSRLSHVLRLDETSLVAHVQAGLTGIELEKVLAPRRLSLGDYPPAALRSSIGGLLAVRTPGKSSPRHGFIEDAVLGLSAVLADGRTIHTRMAPRRSTGPDLARALCGSEGTLGFITSVYLRIHRRPEARFLAAHALPDLAAALATVHLALREEAAPAALRVYDSAEARAHLGEGVARAGEAVVVVATAGSTDLAVCDRDLVASAAQAMGGRALDEQVAQRWWRRRTGRTEGRPLPRPAMQVTASPSRQVAVYRAVRRAAEAAGMGARAHISHFDSDGAVLFFTFTSAGTALAGEALSAVRQAAETAASEAGGLLLGDVNRAATTYLEALRAELDPAGIMNPGALRDGDAG